MLNNPTAITLFRTFTYGLICSFAFAWSVLCLSTRDDFVVGVLEIPKTLNVINEYRSLPQRDHQDDTGLAIVLPTPSLPNQSSPLVHFSNQTLVKPSHARPRVRAPPFLHLS